MRPRTQMRPRAPHAATPRAPVDATLSAYTTILHPQHVAEATRRAIRTPDDGSSAVPQSTTRRRHLSREKIFGAAHLSTHFKKSKYHCSHSPAPLASMRSLHACRSKQEVAHGGMSRRGRAQVGRQARAVHLRQGRDRLREGSRVLANAGRAVPSMRGAPSGAPAGIRTRTVYALKGPVHWPLHSSRSAGRMSTGSSSDI
jgi:hypothetical protein